MGRGCGPFKERIFGQARPRHAQQPVPVRGASGAWASSEAR